MLPEPRTPLITRGWALWPGLPLTCFLASAVAVLAGVVLLLRPAFTEQSEQLPVGTLFLCMLTYSAVLVAAAMVIRRFSRCQEDLEGLLLIIPLFLVVSSLGIDFLRVDDPQKFIPLHRLPSGLRRTIELLPVSELASWLAGLAATALATGLVAIWGLFHAVWRKLALPFKVSLLLMAAINLILPQVSGAAFREGLHALATWAWQGGWLTLAVAGGLFWIRSGGRGHGLVGHALWAVTAVHLLISGYICLPMNYSLQDVLIIPVLGLLGLQVVHCRLVLAVPSAALMIMAIVLTIFAWPVTSELWISHPVTLSVISLLGWAGLAWFRHQRTWWWMVGLWGAFLASWTAYRCGSPFSAMPLYLAMATMAVQLWRTRQPRWNDGLLLCLGIWATIQAARMPIPPGLDRTLLVGLAVLLPAVGILVSGIIRPQYLHNPGRQITLCLLINLDLQFQLFLLTHRGLPLLVLLGAAILLLVLIGLAYWRIRKPLLFLAGIMPTFVGAVLVVKALLLIRVAWFLIGLGLLLVPLGVWSSLKRSAEVDDESDPVRS